MKSGRQAVKSRKGKYVHLAFLLATGSLVAALAAALAAAAASCRKGQSARARSSPQKERIVSVETEPAGRRAFRRAVVSEVTIQPSERVLIGPSVPGVIRKITKQEGDVIKRGEVLVVVSPKEVYVQTIPLRSNLAASRAQLQAYTEVIEKLKAPYGRARKLYKDGVISKAKLDEIEVQYTTAVSKRKAAEYTTKRLRAELGQAYSKLKDTTLTAPFDGFVVRRLVDEGDIARPFPPTIILVVTKHVPVIAEGQVAEHEMVLLEQGLRAEVTVDALPGRLFEGTLRSIRPQVDPITRTTNIRVELPNKDLAITPGMTGRILFTLKPRSVLAVRRIHLASKPSAGKADLFVMEKGRAVLKTVELGPTLDADWVEVRKGLSEGEMLVTAGLDRLRNGDRLEVKHGRRQ